ncbi:MAG: polyprenyl synthetase family protein [Chloroflexi bacterium]|nr:polyprenyl synthetase family protein [Chloroflexota bacterium]
MTARQDDLEAALKALVADRPLALYRMMGYHMGWVETTGEERSAPAPLRVHGALVLMVCDALGGDYRDALPHASAVEYLYNHILIHDDIRDGNSERAGRGSVWWSWGPAQAINTGDGMHALARLALFGMRSSASSDAVSDALRVLDEANLETCEGQYRDITLQERLDVGIDEYLAMSEGQTGALLACAVRLGALVAGQSSEAISAGLGEFGRKLGAAIRVADDYSVFWPDGERDEARQGRLVAKKKTLPFAHALESGSPTDRRVVGEIYMERVIDPASAERLTAVLDAAGSKVFSTSTIARLVNEAISALEAANLPVAAIEELAAAARFLATPDGLDYAAMNRGEEV